METLTLPENPPPPRPAAIDYSSNVDTSRAFRSVKEAVAVFGERFLTGEIFLPPPKPPFSLPKQETLSANSPQTSWKSCSSSRESCQEEEPPSFLVASMKKIQSELEETKKELKLLKERETETEVALASLNAEVHKNIMSKKIVKAEEVAVEKVAAVGLDMVVSGGGGGRKKTVERRSVKKKPLIPLLRDLFSKKKRKPNAPFVNPIYTSSRMRWISKLGFT